uniref:Uncharacterized protein n=1 Tax=Ditylenchus dipsaci TaxID=166011 RepID=A0A915DH89_9BILA
NGHDYNSRVKKWNEVSEEEVVSIQQAAKLSENDAAQQVQEFPAVPDKIVFEDAQPSDVVGNASEVEHKVEEKTQQMNSL